MVTSTTTSGGKSTVRRSARLLGKASVPSSSRDAISIPEVTEQPIKIEKLLEICPVCNKGFKCLIRHLSTAKDFAHRQAYEDCSTCKGCGKKASEFKQRDSFNIHQKACLEKRGTDEFIEAAGCIDSHGTPTSHKTCDILPLMEQEQFGSGS